MEEGGDFIHQLRRTDQTIKVVRGVFNVSSSGFVQTIFSF
jgi:hypothetical protein